MIIIDASEILGHNGKAVVEPFSPLRLVIDLKEAEGPYRAGVQTLEPAPPPGPIFAPDFVDFARIIRDGKHPDWSPEHDLVTCRKHCSRLGSVI